ncbi:hypothetical protein DYBT9275_05070 [Dyadobacter sp. CECT 9275]|uniref:FecR family protein n=1 Tax=Dyadobacter helix TaxID=2822344 RepID=A0A916NE52_9BACT|nr:FecR family protein [Dyadobacter sp. CECT 9275]CAG5011985.1 hypothetical protein DYBT9275_05070 [Dyadobacter sp. CECT 9275]
MDYTKFTAEDLVLDGYFRKWVNQQLPPEDTFWENWLADHPDKAEIISQAKFVISALEMKHAVISDQHVYQKTQSIFALTDADDAPAPSLWSYSLKIAASFAAIVLFSLGWYLLRKEDKKVSVYETMLAEARTAPFTEKVNDTNHPIKVSLLDGSVITLQPKSKLSYPQSFKTDKREVYLSGEGFFEITKIPHQPFFVYANEIITKVLGTSFTVKAYENDKNVIVKVLTGKVTVTSKNKETRELGEEQPEAVILLPNQMGIYTRPLERLTKTLVENPVILQENIPVPANFNFNNTPVEEAFNLLEKSYGVTIVYDGDLLGKCHITAPLEDESLYEKLDLICKVIRASYEIIDAQIIITSKGCS